MATKRNNINHLAELYLSARRPFLKESSYAHYVELTEHYIGPYLGKLSFEDLDCSMAGEYVRRLSKT